jgi:uncharacterized membrane protein
VLWWLTGIVMLFVGKDDADIKYHAAQSIVFFGAYSVVQVILSFLGAALGTAIGFIIGLVSLVLAIYALVVWILSMVWAWQRGGARFEIPLVGNFVARYAEQLAASVK